MKIHSFQDLQRDITEKSARLREQRESIKFEKTMLKKAWVETITSPPALLLSLSIGFVTAYLRKSKANIPSRRASKIQSAIINAIKRFSSGFIVGIISAISSRTSGLAAIPQEEYPVPNK